MTQDKTLYDALKAAGAELDHHESDLYVKHTPRVAAILREHGRADAVGFTSETDGLLWLEVPFAYQPFWDEKARTSSLTRIGWDGLHVRSAEDLPTYEDEVVE